MDWIETLFGISPDGGDGSTEVLLLAAAVAIAALIVARVRDSETMPGAYLPAKLIAFDRETRARARYFSREGRASPRGPVAAAPPHNSI